MPITTARRDVGIGRSRALAVALTAGVVFGVAQVGNAAPGYPLLGNGWGGTLYDVNTSTGLATNPRATGINYLTGIASDADGTIYGLTTFASSPANAVVRIDPLTGTYTTVGATGLREIYEGDLDFDPTTGVLYGLQDVPATGDRYLFTINKSTGAAAHIGNINAPDSDLSAMTFDAAGNLYVLDTGQDILLGVSKYNAAILSSAPLSTRLGAAAGMDFDPLTGILYVADGETSGTDNLYTLNPSTGALSLVGWTGLTEGLAGLTFIVPEPAALSLLALGGLAVIRRRRK